MSNAYFLQKTPINVTAAGTAGDRNVTIGSLRLPAGAWVIFAKFEVAIQAGADNDLRQRISQFGLEFGGQKDTAFCHLNQGGLDTVVLNVAGTYSRSLAVSVGSGGGSLFTKAVLFCESSTDDFEVLHLAMTAISVDSIN